MLKVFYDWLVLPVADFIATLALMPLVCAPLVATAATWVYVTRVRDGKRANGGRFIMFLMAAIASAYVFVVTSVAVARLPHAYFTFMKADD